MFARLRSVLAVLVTALVLTACIDVEKVVQVKPDGSGVVEETLLMKKEMVAMMKSMAAGMGGEAPAPLLDEAKLQESAAGMGSGVTLLDAEPITTATGEGYRARFAFADINQLRLDQNPGGRAPDTGDATDGPAAADKEEPVTFVFQGGDEPLLIIRPPRGQSPGPSEKANGSGQAPSSPDDPGAQMAMMMMSQFFDGLRVAVYVVPEGEIIETTASHREGSRITLMEMDFGKLIQDPARFQTFVQQEPNSLEEAKTLMKDLPGVKVDHNPEVQIRFRGN